MSFQNLYMYLIVTLVIFSSCEGPSTSESDGQINAKVDSVLQLMNLEEKLGQLNMPAAGDITTGLAQNIGIATKIAEGKVGALLNIQGIDKIHEAQRIAVEESRLGIPLIFAMDVIHGYKTVFPIPLGLSCTWNMEMIEKTARMAAREASAEGISLTFSPMVDISRDPRWGRISEGSGEDPFMQSEIARAMVNGYQQDELSSNTTLMGCVKHFALYGAPLAGRDYNTVDMSRLQMYNVYFPPFKAAVEENVGCVMAAFNDLDAIPATGSAWLMTEVLRNQWGFDGFVVTDYTGINEMTAHGLGDLQAVSELALEAGIDMDMVGEGFLTTLEESYEDGKVSMDDIDQAVRRVLTAKYKLGLFEDPYQYGDKERSQREVFSAEHREFAREVSAESLVLLKNENDLLPLQANGSIAVIGPLVTNAENMTGTWSVAADFEKSVSLVEGLSNVVGDQVNILHAKGANIYRDPELEAKVSIFGKPTNRDSRSPEVMRDEALEIARQSDVIIAALGEAAEMSGESSSRSDIGIPEVQMELLKALQETGKPVVLVLFTGRPLAIPWAAENVPAILNAWFPGTEAGNAIAEVVFGEVNPSGKLTTTFPRNVGQVPIYYAAKSTGRPQEGDEFQKFRSNYLDVPNSPLYPFGYGLSYSDFEYSEVSLSASEATGNDTITASVQVTNNSNRDGKEAVQLYIHDVVASNTRPNLELKGFEKVMIAAGETVTVSFPITSEMLKFYKYDPETGYRDVVHAWEPGDFEIMIGSSAADWRKKTLVWQK